jgi:CheY-like chemotaxis protein
MFATGERPAILVVEDDSAMRNTVVDMLEANGFTVVDARSGREALDILAGDPTIKLVFTDVMMPGISGTVLAKKAAEIRPDVRIVLTTGFSDLLPRDGVANAAVLRKPYRMDDLLVTVQEQLGTAVRA